MNTTILSIILKIKSLITEQFPEIMVVVTSDDKYGDVIVSIDNKDVYYSSKYQELISHINLNVLWPANIDNFIFVLNEQLMYESHFNEFSCNTVTNSDLRWTIQNFNYCNFYNNSYFYNDIFTKAA